MADPLRPAVPPPPPSERGSSTPPSIAPPPVTRARHDTLTEIVVDGPWEDGWRPANNDFTARATSWRAWHALNRTERHKMEIATVNATIDRLNATIEKGLAFLAGLVRFLRWAGAILGAAGLLAGAGWLVHWILTLHH